MDIPFPRSIRDALLDEGLAEEHHWLPDSGWVAFRVRTEHDVKHALWLMWLSYLRYALKHAADPVRLFEEERKQLRLGQRFQLLLGPFVPKSAKANEVSVQPVKL